MHSLKKILWDTIHRCRSKTVAQLADELGISESYLYRGALPYDDQGSGCRFPADLLIPLMLSTRNFSILHHLANRLGFICFRPPRGRARTAKDLNDFQKTFNGAFGALWEFYFGEKATAEGACLTKEQTKECLDRLYELLQATAAHRRDVERGRQGELEIE